MRPTLVLLASIGCSGQLTSTPPEPGGVSSSIYDLSALAQFAPDDRSYVMGHAMGIYLYGKTLPEHVAGTGFSYDPGVSAPHAQVPYDFHAVVSAPTGGVDGAGAPGLDDVGTEGGATGGGEGGTDDPMIDSDCETFLDPAALDARDLADQINAGNQLGPALATDLRIELYYSGLKRVLHVEDLDENTDESEVEHLKETVQGAGLCEHSPIIVDLDGDGIEAGDPREGVAFDLRQTGTPVLSAWPRGDDAFLAMDHDGDGRISHGGELFGATRRYRDGFAALAELDRVDRGGNGDGVLDAADAGFARLLLWADADRDGESDPSELVPLAVEGIARLPLAHVRSTDHDRDGNALREQGRFLRRDGRAGAMVDVWLRIRAVPEGPRRMWF